MSQFSTKRDESGQLVPYGKGAMRLRRQEKREEAEARQLKAILSVHPNGVCDCKGKPVRQHRTDAQHTVIRNGAAEKSDAVKKTRRGKR